MGKYCQNNSLLKVQPEKSASHGWRGILAGRDLLIEQLGKVVGDGSTTKVWRDPWISTSSALMPFGPVREEESDLYVSDLLLRDKESWNIARIEELLPTLKNEIMAIRPSITGQQDSYIWYPVASGAYTAKSGYAAASEQKVQEITQPATSTTFKWHKAVWNVACSPKLKLLVWKTLHEALPTGQNLQRRGVINNISCIHCGGSESVNHLFLHCTFAATVWNLVPLQSPFCSTMCPSIAIALEASSNWTCLPPTGVSINTLFWIMWALWNTRNQILFESRHTNHPQKWSPRLWQQLGNVSLLRTQSTPHVMRKRSHLSL